MHYIIKINKYLVEFIKYWKIYKKQQTFAKSASMNLSHFKKISILISFFN